MGLVPQQDLSQLAQTEPEPVLLPFAEGVSAVFDAGRLTDQSISTTNQLHADISNSMRRLGELGGPKGEIPPYLLDSTADAALGWLDSHKDAILARRSPDLGPPDPLLKTGEEIRQGLKQRVSEAQALASRAGIGAQLVGGAGVAFTDPLNLALLPLGVAGAETMLARIAGEAAIAGASQVGVEAASLGAKERAGVDASLSGAAGRVAMTAAFGGALGGIFHGIGRAVELRSKVAAYRKAVADGTVTPNRATEAAADAIQDHLDTVPPQATPGAEAAHLEATTAAVDVLQATSPEAEAMAVRRLAEKAKAWEESSIPEEAVDALKARDANPRNLPAADEIAAMSRELEVADRQALDAAAEPRERIRQTLLAEIRRRGGMSTPTNFLEGRMLGQSGLLTAIRRDGRGIDQWHATMLEEGTIPAGTDIDDFFEMLTGGTKNMEAQDAAAARAFEKESGLESMRSYIGQLEEARAFLRGPDGPEPTLGQVEDYLADPQGYIRRYTEEAMQAALRAEADSPRLAVIEPSVDAPAVDIPSLPDAERVSFDALTTERPDLTASFVDSDGIAKSGTARELMQQAEEEATTLREILACVLKGGPE